MRNELKDELLPILLEPRTLQRGYFRAEAIRGVLHEHFAGRRDHSGILWMLLVFELWHRNFLEKYGSVQTEGSSPCAAEAMYGKPTVSASVGENVS
jgi:asparagine synthase (glutamine-hydrolysing)